MIWKLISFIGYIIYPVLWLLGGIFIFCKGVWDLWNKIVEAFKEFLAPNCGYYIYPDRKGNPQTVVQLNQQQSEQKDIMVAKAYHKILTRRIRRSVNIAELNKYIDKLDKVASKPHFSVVHYQELINCYYYKLEQLESLAALDAGQHKEECIDSRQT